MMPDEVQIAFEAVTPFKFVDRIKNKKQWAVLFKYYNIKNNRRLCLDCGICYKTVYSFVSESLKYANI